MHDPSPGETDDRVRPEPGGPTDSPPKRRAETLSRFAAERRRRLRTVLERLSTTPLDREALTQVAGIAGELGFEVEHATFSRAAASPDDPEAIYAVGYLLVDSGMPALGARFLERCLELAPEPAVAYELGYARLRAGDLGGAEPLLARSFATDLLDDRQVFSAGALLVECRVRAGESRRAREALERLEHAPGERDEAQLDALARLVARSERQPSTGDDLPRDERSSLFVLGAAILLHQPRERRKSFGASLAGLDFLAGLLRRFEAVLEAVRYSPLAVTTPVEALAPIGRALARRLGVEFAPPGSDSKSSLVLLRTPDDVVPNLAQLRDATDGSFLFALAADPRRDMPLVPDCVGLLTERLVLPWEERIEVTAGDGPDGLSGRKVDSRDAGALNRVATDIFDAMAAMEGDATDLRALADYYLPLIDLLSANRPDDFPERGSAPALLPATS